MLKQRPRLPASKRLHNKNTFFLLLSCLALLALGCRNGFPWFSKTESQQEHHPKALKIGTIAGPETELMESVKKRLSAKHGLEIEIVEFSDFVTPNLALFDGSIDANAYQTIPYLEEAMKSRGYQFAIVGKTFLYPMGVYSKKIKK